MVMSILKELFSRKINTVTLFIIAFSCFLLLLLNIESLNSVAAPLGIITFIFAIANAFLGRNQNHIDEIPPNNTIVENNSLLNIRQKIGLGLVLFWPFLALIIGFEEFGFFFGFGGFILTLPSIFIGLFLLITGSFLRRREVKNYNESPEKSRIVIFARIVIIMATCCIVGVSFWLTSWLFI
jgi:hypothetical protein